MIDSYTAASFLNVKVDQIARLAEMAALSESGALSAPNSTAELLGWPPTALLSSSATTESIT